MENPHPTPRRWRRVPVELPAIVVCSNAPGRPAAIVDVSRGGARVRTQAALDVGAYVKLYLYGFSQGPMLLEGEVVHAAGNESGVRFDDTWDLPRLSELLGGLRA